MQEKPKKRQKIKLIGTLHGKHKNRNKKQCRTNKNSFILISITILLFIVFGCSFSPEPDPNKASLIGMERNSTVLSHEVITLAVENPYNKATKLKVTEKSSTEYIEPEDEKISYLASNGKVSIEDVEDLEMPPEVETTEEEVADISDDWDFEYNEEDVRMLGDLMYAEEGVLLVRQPYEIGKRAHILAGSVVLNRLADGRWGDTIEDVIFDGIGYAQTTRDRIGNIETPEEVYEWAEELLENGPEGPRTLVFQAQFKQGVGVYEQIDNQYFCLMAG